MTSARLNRLCSVCSGAAAAAALPGAASPSTSRATAWNSAMASSTESWRVVSVICVVVLGRICSAHAPCVPRHPGRGRARVAAGTRAPHRRPGDRYRAGPRRPGQASSRASCEARRDPFGSPRAAISAPALRRFLSRFDLWLSAAPLPEGRFASRHFAGQRFPAIAGASALAVLPGLPDVGSANTKTYLPGAGRCYAGCWYRRPAASRDGRYPCRVRRGSWRRQRNFSNRRSSLTAVLPLAVAVDWLAPIRLALRSCARERWTMCAACSRQALKPARSRISSPCGTALRTTWPPEARIAASIIRFSAPPKSRIAHGWRCRHR